MSSYYGVEGGSLIYESGSMTERQCNNYLLNDRDFLCSGILSGYVSFEIVDESLILTTIDGDTHSFEPAD